MADPHNGTIENTKEIKINPPKPFTGKRDDLRRFIQEVILCLTINAKTYDNDAKKIIFALSYMNDGEALAWKEQLVDKVMDDATRHPTNELNFGTFQKFLDDLKKVFAPYDAPGDALEEMKTMRMGNTPVDEHIAKFKILVSKSTLDSKSPAVPDMFRETLNVPLQRRLLQLEKPPTTIDEWYDWTSKLDNNFRKMQRILGRTTRPGNNGQNQNQSSYTPRRYNFSTPKDPNAMDVDALTIEERNNLMKIGACFKCRKPGHLARECPTKIIRKKEEPKKTFKGNELRAHIRSLMTNMEEKEKEIFYDQLEEEGF